MYVVKRTRSLGVWQTVFAKNLARCMPHTVLPVPGPPRTRAGPLHVFVTVPHIDPGLGPGGYHVSLDAALDRPHVHREAPIVVGERFETQHLLRKLADRTAALAVGASRVRPHTLDLEPELTQPTTRAHHGTIRAGRLEDEAVVGLSRLGFDALTRDQGADLFLGVQEANPSLAVTEEPQSPPWAPNRW